MEAIASLFQETGQNVVVHGNALVARTRKIGAVVAHETRDAGRDVARLVRVESKRWVRFASRSTEDVTGRVRALLSVKAIERQLLLQVDSTLRAIDSGVRERIHELGEKHEKGTTVASSRRGRKSTRKAARKATKRKVTRHASALNGAVPSRLSGA